MAALLNILTQALHKRILGEQTWAGVSTYVRVRVRVCACVCVCVCVLTHYHCYDSEAMSVTGKISPDQIEVSKQIFNIKEMVNAAVRHPMEEVCSSN